MRIFRATKQFKNVSFELRPFSTTFLKFAEGPKDNKDNKYVKNEKFEKKQPEKKFESHQKPEIKKETPIEKKAEKVEKVEKVENVVKVEKVENVEKEEKPQKIESFYDSYEYTDDFPLPVYGLSTGKGDKWDVDKMKYPILGQLSMVEGSQFAKDLFRHAYNTNQLGFTYFSLLTLERFMRQNGNQGLPFLFTPELAQNLLDAGVSKDVVLITLKEIYNQAKVQSVAHLIEIYQHFYLAYHKVVLGTFRYFSPYGNNCFEYVDRIQKSCINLAPPNSRIIFDHEAQIGSKLGGYEAEFSNQMICMDKMGELFAYHERSVFDAFVETNQNN